MAEDGPVPPEVVDLLHCLGFVYLRHGQAQRAVVLLILAAEAAGDRLEVLRTLCAAMVAANLGAQALDLLDRLATLDPVGTAHPMRRLLRARALLQLGRVEEARQVFGAVTASSGGAA